MTDQEYTLIMRRLEDLKTGQQRMDERLNRIEAALIDIRALLAREEGRTDADRTAR